MKKITFLLSFSFLAIVNSLAQHDVREQVYVHLNSTMFVSGETMHFSAYCSSRFTGKPSELSKILYVEIVGENGPVHQGKIKLDNGRGNSRFFVPSSIPSGQYRLLAYTRWMKNFDDYYHAPVLIVNPFEEYANPPELVDHEFKLFPLHESLVAGVENVVAFFLNAKSPSRYNGRIVSSEGEVVSTFRVKQSGLGKMNFTPLKGQSYQVILEDSLGNINFHRLPSVEENGSFIVYQENKEELSFKLQTTDKALDSLVLSLSDGNTWYQKMISPHTYFTIPKKVFPYAGIFLARYTDGEGETVAERAVLVTDTKLVSEPLARSYGIREKVHVKPALEEGSYSISVRKKAFPKIGNHQHAVWARGLQGILTSEVSPARYFSAGEEVDQEVFLLASTTRRINETPAAVALLPEMREELLVGRIKDMDGEPVARQALALTFPGREFQLRISESDDQGNFIIPFQSSGADSEAIITALDFNKRHEINVDSPFLNQYPDFNYQLPYLDSNLVKEIIKKSIRVQIENAYFDPLPLYSEAVHRANEIPYHDIYRLDDYRRFPTLKETFTEFITTASIRENRDYVIKTTYFPGLGQAGYPPLVLLDGVPVSGERVTQLSPYRVESIGVLPNRYFLGTKVMDGIVGIKTFDQEYGDFQLTTSGNHQRILMLGVRHENAYSFPDYSENIDRHKADQRDQLFWEPAFRPEQQSEISFYTSDVPGEYEIVIEGFTNDGEPVSMVYAFWVETASF